MTIDVTVTVPDTFFNLPATIKRIIDGMNGILDSTATSFAATHDTWSATSKPAQTIVRAKQSGNSIVGSVKLTGEIYALVNNGTDPRPRSARSSKGMRFRRGYRRKTVPGRLVSGSSERFGPWVNKQHVVSGAIEAGNFDKTIADQEAPNLLKVAKSAPGGK